MQQQPEQIPTGEVSDSGFGEFEAAVIESNEPYWKRAERRQEAYIAAHKQLMTELIEAVMQDPAREIATPEWTDKRMPAHEVIGELLDHRGADGLWREAVWLIGQIAAGKFDHQVHLRGSALLAVLARQHADFHADIVAEAAW